MKNILKIVIIFLCSNSFALDINDAIRSTIEKNPKVTIALEKLNESKELLIYSKGFKLPTISTTISGTYKNSDTTTSTSKSTPETFTDAYKITISQNIYDAGYSDLEIERSKVLYNSELVKAQIIIQDLILDAIQGYLSVLNYEKSLEATRKNYDSVMKAYEETKTRFNLGSATLYDLQDSEASYAVSKTNLFSAEENVKISKKTFNKIVGLKPLNLEDILDIDKLISLEMIVENSLKTNLEVILISNNIKNKEILMLKEKKLKKANLDLTGTGLYSNGSRLERGTETTSGSIALKLTIPLFQKGQDDSNIRKYRSQMFQEEIKLQDAKDDLEILIYNTYKDFKISQSRMQSNLIIIKSIETALESLKEEYSIGTKTINNLVDEEEKLLNANVNYLNSKKDLVLNYFKIKSLDGSLFRIIEKYLPVIN